MINKFITKLAERLEDYKTELGLTSFKKFEVVFKKGRKYTKVWSQRRYENGDVNGRDIVAFINEETGEIFMPAGHDERTGSEPDIRLA